LGIIWECIMTLLVGEGMVAITNLTKEPHQPTVMAKDSCPMIQLQTSGHHVAKKNLKVQYQSIGAANWCLASSGGDCQDKPAWASNCPGWAAQFCSHSFWGSWMATNCKKSCNKCDAPDIVKVCKGEKGCAAMGGNESWKNDKWCDDINNNEACGWDGGACCNNSQSTWDNYCYLCQCLDPSKTFSHNGHVAGSKPV